MTMIVGNQRSHKVACVETVIVVIKCLFSWCHCDEILLTDPVRILYLLYIFFSERWWRKILSSPPSLSCSSLYVSIFKCSMVSCLLYNCPAFCIPKLSISTLLQKFVHIKSDVWCAMQRLCAFYFQPPENSFFSQCLSQSKHNKTHFLPSETLRALNHFSLSAFNFPDASFFMTAF